jgi:hypothetical protein
MLPNIGVVYNFLHVIFFAQSACITDTVTRARDSKNKVVCIADSFTPDATQARVLVFGN